MHFLINYWQKSFYFILQDIIRGKRKKQQKNIWLGDNKIYILLNQTKKENMPSFLKVKDN